MLLVLDHIDVAKVYLPLCLQLVCMLDDNAWTVTRPLRFSKSLGWWKSDATCMSQVIKEVAVLDNINPGGLYAGRVKLLGRCAILLCLSCLQPRSCSHGLHRPSSVFAICPFAKRACIKDSPTLTEPRCRYSPKASAFAGPPSLGAEDIPDPLYGNAGKC